MYLATSAQIREADRLQINEKHVPGILLMETAGRKTAEHILSLFPAQQAFLVLAGPGNNGGDGLVIARYLHLAGKEVQVLLSHPEERYQGQGDAATNYHILRALPVPLISFSEDAAQQALAQFQQPPMLIDALLGTGIQSALRPPISQIIEYFRTTELEVLAVDLPSGLNADTGSCPNDVLPARATFTFQLPKVCHYVSPAAQGCGEVYPIDIGIWPEVIESLGVRRRLIDEAFLRAHPPRREREAHKGTFGHLLVIGGSRSMGGAPAMSAFAAMQAGVGLCTALVPSQARPFLQALCPEVMCLSPEQGASSVFTEAALELAQSALKEKDAVVLGPGMGQHPDTHAFLRRLLPLIDVPLVLDADGLNHLAKDESLWDALPATCVLTPHPGEMQRLFSDFPVKELRMESAEALAKLRASTVVLKGAGTVVALPGGDTWVNTSGNAGMASAGTGDVLAGAMGALLAQGLPPETAAPLAVYLHGKAGDALAQRKGQSGVTATELARGLSQAWHMGS